jgi:hypothetical protein
MLVDNELLVERARETGDYSVAEYLASLNPVKEFINPRWEEGAIVAAYFDIDSKVPESLGNKFRVGTYLMDLTETPGMVNLTPLTRGSEAVEPIDIETFMAKGYANGLVFKVKWVPEPGEYAPFYRRIE